ncbi:amino acid ABC transporter ATP-binding protein [Lichenibacterium ramalinae]|uniref:Amino acid ABC transporter ATP-binding protein n=1 Tax=Lichenibacterium ramalinae TaxID=2316527 RepID=A0A4Q2R8T3_9HYPH|nr:amino acid ABC transporter ATP-binding protein [Lichenibacterium ramalinae]RYB01914.1 amino acid ABC transporter ATP-binding protein [Lichenibacterium ramalinae]
MNLDSGMRAAGVTVLAREPVLRLDAVGKRFGALVVLDDINLTLRAGEVVSLIGPGGSGRSTLLRCIDQLEPPTSGRVRVGGLSIEAGHPPTRAELSDLRRMVGMVFRSPGLFPHLTVLRNVSLALERVLGRGRVEAEARGLALLERVGLAGRAHHTPSRCSDGEQQRIAIARALAIEPRLMLFDEPTAALDPEPGREVLALMRSLADDGMTMLVATHELQFAETVSDRVVVMAEGRVVEQGASRQVIHDPRSDRARRFLDAVLNR